MEKSAAVPRIIEALRMRDSVVITFEDCTYAKYPASLLYSLLPKAAEMSGDLSDPDQVEI